ncbi:MAG: hypothetical protein AAB365_04145 [Patescibacteria group bacterium]
MKDLCVKLSGIGALLICIPVMWRISQGDVFNPASYFLWSLLSLVCVLVLLRDKKGGHTMMIGYVASDFLIGFYAYRKLGKASFGSFEWLIVALTGVCVCIWLWCEHVARRDKKQDFKPSVITNTVACMIAGIPQIIDSFKNPYQVSFVICAFYMLVSGLAYYGEKPTLNGRLLPGVSIIYWIIMIVGLIIARSIAPTTTQ